MEVLCSSRDVAIGSLTANAVTGHQYIYNGTPKQDLNSLINPIHDASHMRNRKISPPDSSCLPGTRRGPIHTVSSWAEKKKGSDGTHVYWLYGYVGCGKSAIAQAIAEKFHQRGRLAASFFFFRNSGPRAKIGKLAATISSQMTVAIPATAPLIEAAVTADPRLVTSSVTIGTQFKQLVFDPFLAAVGRWFGLSTTKLKGPYLIVIDGLDECEDHDEVAEFIDHMLTFFKKNPLAPLRILITSRVEEHIRTRLQDDKVTMDNLVNHCSDDDIAAVVRATFDHAAKHDRVVQAYGNWPAQTDVSSLVTCSGGSFIFISMLLKYILGPSADGLTPMERLPLALDINRHSSLDGLYAETLSRSKDLPHFTEIISAISLVKEPLSIASLSGMLGIKIFEVVRVLVNLHAILQVPGDDVTPVTVCHSSLHDFFTTESRSGPFYASPSFHKRLAYRCLDLPVQYRYPDEPLAKYAFKYVARHFQTAWDIELDDVGDLCRLYRDIHTALKNRFPKSAAIVVPAYFPWTLTNKFREPQIEILSTILGPSVPAGETASIFGTLTALLEMDPLDSRTLPSTDHSIWSIRLGESNLPHFSDYMHFPLRCISLLFGSPLPQNRDREDDGRLFRRIFTELPLNLLFALDRDSRNGAHFKSICEPVGVVDGGPMEIDDIIHLNPFEAGEWGRNINATITKVMKRPVHVMHDPSRWVETELAGDFIESQGPLSVMGVLEGFRALADSECTTFKVRLGRGVGISFARPMKDRSVETFGYRTTAIHRKSYVYEG